MRLLALALLVAVAFGATAEEVGDVLGGVLGKEVICEGEGPFTCTISYEDYFGIRCAEECVVSTPFGKEVLNDPESIDRISTAIDLLPAEAFCSFAEKAVLNGGQLEGCSCSKESAGVKCFAEEVMIEVSCTEDYCTAMVGIPRKFPLKRTIRLADSEVVREIPGGTVRIYEEGGKRNIDLQVENAKGIRIKLKGKIKDGVEGGELRAALKGEFKELREKIRRVKKKDVEVLTALDFDPADVPLGEMELVFEVPCSLNSICDRELEVWHIKDDGSAEVVDGLVSRSGEYLTIKVVPSSFSIYALATVGQVTAEPEEIPLKPETNTICLAGLLLPVAAGGLLRR